MTTNETEKRKNLVMIAAAGEWDGVMNGLFKQHSTASPKEQQRLGKIIKVNISKIKTEFPVIAEHYRKEYETYISHYQN